LWSESEKIMRSVLESSKIKFVEGKGEAAFYGPKADIQIKNVFGKEDTIITVQLDLLLPKRFNLKYKTADNKYETPVVIHRSSIGALERTMAFLIERYQGAFPTWLAPVQVKLLTFTSRNEKYARKIEKELLRENIRIETDYSPSTVQAKVREAELQKIPYILCVGDKEEKAKTIAVRIRGKKPKFGVKLDSFIKHIKKEINERKIAP